VVDSISDSYTFTSALSLNNTGGLYSILPSTTCSFTNANLTDGAGHGNCTILNSASGTAGGYKIGFCVNGTATVITSGNISNSGDLFSWSGSSAGTATIEAASSQSFQSFYMTGGNLWADYNNTSTGVGRLNFMWLNGTFSGGTLNLYIWKGGGSIANGSSSKFSFSGTVATGTNVLSVTAQPLGLQANQRVPSGQSSYFLTSSVRGGLSGNLATTSIPIPDGNGLGHSWTFLLNSLDSDWIGTSWS
jgi:hypothetical protein